MSRHYLSIIYGLHDLSKQGSKRAEKAAGVSGFCAWTADRGGNAGEDIDASWTGVYGPRRAALDSVRSRAAAGVRFCPLKSAITMDGPREEAEGRKSSERDNKSIKRVPNPGKWGTLRPARIFQSGTYFFLDNRLAICLISRSIEGRSRFCGAKMCPYSCFPKETSANPT